MHSYKKTSISVVGLSMLMTGAVDGVSNLPSIAIFGPQIIFFFLVAVILFLIPTGLISAELCAQFKEKSGIYEWSKMAFGHKTSLLAVWLQWINTLIYFPTCLATLVGTLAYLFYPALLHQPLFLVIISLLIFWIVTIVNLKGVKASTKIASLSIIGGLIIPMALVLGLSSIWLILGKPHAIQLHLTSSLPHMSDLRTWSALTAIITAFLGMELATVHVNKTKNANKIFPRALLLTIIIVILTMGLGSLGVAMIIPHEQLQLIGGAMQIVNALLANFHLLWLAKILGVMLLFGSIGALINWLISPACGLAHAAQDKLLPSVLGKENKHGAPQNILILQAIIVSIVLLAFFIMPSMNGSYWLLLDLSTELYLFMYVIMFITAIKLLWYNSKITIIPAGKFGAIIVSACGLVGCLIAITVGFIPPSNINTGSVSHYEAIFCSGLFVALTPVWFLLAYKKVYKPRWLYK